MSIPSPAPFVSCLLCCLWFLRPCFYVVVAGAGTTASCAAQTMRSRRFRAPASGLTRPRRCRRPQRGLQCCWLTWSLSTAGRARSRCRAQRPTSPRSIPSRRFFSRSCDAAACPAPRGARALCAACPARSCKVHARMGMPVLARAHTMSSRDHAPTHARARCRAWHGLGSGRARSGRKLRWVSRLESR